MDIKEWIGKRENRSDSIAPETLQRFEAMMDRDPSSITEGSELPPCAHWCYFTPPVKRSDIAENGHPEQGDFQPPIDQPTRMWAGGKIEFRKPMKTGVPANRSSTITKIEEKEGKSGPLTFVEISHAISKGGTTMIIEDQQLVYRESTDKGAYPTREKPLDIDPDWTKSITPDVVTLFRFSALTFNAHRIHYDRDYAKNVEGYPDLVVHGPLLLVYLLDEYMKNSRNRVIRSLEYKLEGPIYLGEEINIHCGKGIDSKKSELRITGPDKKLALKADLEWGYNWD